MAPKETANYFGGFLVSQGELSQEDLDKALKHKEEANRRIGAHAVERGLLAEEQVERIIAEQKNRDKPFGAIALDWGLLTQGQLDQLLFAQTVYSTHLGEVLMDLGILSPARFEALLTEYKRIRDQAEEHVAQSLDRQEDKQVFRAVIGSLENAFVRFADQGLKVLSLAEDMEPTLFRVRVDVRMEIGAAEALTCSHFLPQDFALALAGGFTGKEPERCRKECLLRVEEFFLIMERYLASALEEMGHEVRDSEVRVTKLEPMPDMAGKTCRMLHAVTNAGGFGLQIKKTRSGK
ncbi:MAG: hypothetical protein D6E12_00940 [Desulfovibrio sp.]|nr:MAG: hypothetical protein D6E12_00940 [Desulfovibrio sp.]